MPLGPRRRKLEADLLEVFGEPEAPATGLKLAKALSRFSLGILPPTIGVFTGIQPSAAAYDSAPPFEKTMGIENAINTFASFNTSGVPPVIPGFVASPPPPIKGLQRLFDIVRDNKGTTSDIAKLLSYAILANYSLGNSTFTPLSIFVPTWNIPIIPASIRNSDEYEEASANKNKAMRRAEEAEQYAQAAEDDDSLTDTDLFFEESNPLS